MRSDNTATDTELDFAIEEVEAMVLPVDADTVAKGAGLVAVGFLALAVFC